MPPSIKTRKARRGCRICLCGKSENRVTFDVNSDWARLFHFCFDITVNENGPKELCGQCSKKLTEFSELKTLAIKSDSLWNIVVSPAIKSDQVEIEIESVQIKDEEGPEQYYDTEYNDWQMDSTCETNEVLLVQGNESSSLLKVTKTIKEETETVKPDTVESDSPKSLTENQFIKKYFKVIKSNTGRMKTIYECLNCGQEFKRRTPLSDHIQKCQQSEIIIVKDQPKVEKTKELPLTFYCGLCDFTSANEKVVTSHVSEHCKNNEMNCKLCEYVGRDTADVVSHRYKHMPEEFNYKIECPTCNKVRKNPLTLQFHYRSVHLKKIGGWCSVCNKTFNDYKYFRNHERLHKSENFTCDYCGMKFLFRNGIVMHMRELHLNIRNFVCDTCGKAFKRNNALTYHIRAHHANNKPVPCSHCGKKFKNDYSLKAHMKMVKREKNYICEICSKGYSVLNLLQKHMFRHTGQKPFACEICGMSYKSKQYLQIHRRKHTGDFPFQCGSCDKQFISSTQLKNHTGVHTGIHRVKCLVCDKTFRERKQMLAHCQTKHDSVVKVENQGNSLVAV